MILKELKPKKSLNKAFLKAKPNRTDIERFKSNLITLLNRANETESEEFHKNLVIDFLKKTYYDPHHFINTKGRNDLVIHNGQNAKTSVGVIVEAKKSDNKAEMVSSQRLNTKAFQELVLYYLRERITHKNLEVKHLVITNIYEWFLFDARLFDRLFAQNKALVKQFNDFEAGRLADTKTDFFYRQIAAPFIDSINTEIEFTRFNLQDYQKVLHNTDKADDNSLIALFKLLSPEHLLKLPFANDSNSLDKRFYSELLHIIGLTETKTGSKKVIDRGKQDDRHRGTILEAAIIQLDSLDKISRLDKPSQYGDTREERLFNVALELTITWINRILFLKLLEAQLIAYNRNDKSYTFLHHGKIKNYDDLNSLFFQVLARKYDERNEDVRKPFEKVPYLNSSLFEPTDIEQSTLFISNLKDDKTIPAFSQTVLKDAQGRKRTGNIGTLEYLFDFLSAYDFSSEGSEAIQEENKTLINASVLGLIFEKINGYKDGSFFTPGFITMYMCRETIRHAVVQKFNEIKQWNCTDIETLYDRIADRKEANEIINSIKICDPAVGSGHFLVSALNEIISLKNDLKILQDRDGRRLKEYHVEVVNDELIVTDEDGELFEYHPHNKELQRIQEALFHEKQTIIENCLFGVDINSNSVKICRLRLWIELLKNAYYIPTTLSQPIPALETLPNIDINIKCGNSLVSRFAIDAELKQALKKSKWTIESYRMAVDTYRNADNKEQKRAMERLIADIKSDFRSEISMNDPKVRKLRKLSGGLFQMAHQQQLFEMNKKEKAAWNKKLNQLTEETRKLEAEIEAIKSNKIFENAFEWRFEFPEVLNEDGDFVGFDVVIGNPPYIRQEELAELKPYLKNHYATYAGTADMYAYFVEMSFTILKQKGSFVFIIPNKWMRAGYGKNLRTFVKQYAIKQILDFGDLPVFQEATTYPSIIRIEKEKPTETFSATNISTLEFANGLENYVMENGVEVLVSELSPEGWTLVDSKVQKLLAKLRKAGIPLGEYVNGKIYRGVLTGLNEAFVIDAATREDLIKQDPGSAEIIKPFLAGRDIKRYRQPESDRHLILIKSGDTKKWFGDLEEADAFRELETKYTAIAAHLESFEEKAKARYDKGNYWWELRACDYYEEFEKEKILYQEIAAYSTFGWDSEKYYANNKVFIIPDAPKPLLGFLNSKLVWFYLNKVSNILRGALALQSPYILSIPISENVWCNKELSALVDKVLVADSDAKFQLETKIDQLVYQLYGLTEEEIEIVEKG